MAKLTVNDVLKEMTSGTNAKGKKLYNRFNRKNFEKLLTTMLNDPKFTTKVASVKKGELASVEEIAVSEKIRKWCRKLVEKAGIDSSESAVVMGEDFEVPNMDGFYEFIATAIWLYMEQGNQFDFLPREDFKQTSIVVKDVDPSTKVREARNPATGESLGKYEYSTGKHKKLVVKSSGAPKWLQTRKYVK